MSGPRAPVGRNGDPPDAELARERRRIRAEYARRRQRVEGERYAPWNPAERLMVDERRRLGAQMLHRAGAFPAVDSRCLEIGFGKGGWVPDLLHFGVALGRLHGVEIDFERAADVGARIPGFGGALADAGRLPFADRSFELVIASTVFSSVLDPAVQQAIASEIERVLTTGGHLLWYDFAVSNPRNPGVRGVSRRRLRTLFPRLRGEVRSLTLAPPLARRLAPRSHALAQLLATVPFLRTHLLAVLGRGELFDDP